MISYLPTLPAGVPSQVQRSSVGFSFNNAVTQINTSVDLTAIAASAAAIVASQYPANLQNVVASTVPHVFCETLTNNGGSPATNLQITAMLAPFSILPSSPTCTRLICTGVLGAGASCDVPISFTSQVTGNYSSTFTATYSNGLGAQTLQVAYSSTVTVPTVSAQVTLNPSTSNLNHRFCGFLVDASGVGVSIGCNGGGSKTLSLKVDPDPAACNTLRIVLVTDGSLSWPPPSSGVARDTNNSGDLTYEYYTKSVNTATLTTTIPGIINSGNVYTNADHDKAAFQDFGFTLTLPGPYHFKIQNTSMTCSP